MYLMNLLTLLPLAIANPSVEQAHITKQHIEEALSANEFYDLTNENLLGPLDPYYLKKLDYQWDKAQLFSDQETCTDGNTILILPDRREDDYYEFGLFIVTSLTEQKRVFSYTNGGWKKRGASGDWKTKSETDGYFLRHVVKNVSNRSMAEVYVKPSPINEDWLRVSWYVDFHTFYTKEFPRGYDIEPQEKSFTFYPCPIENYK